MNFEKVVIWGHKLHSHTHSYIHLGFFNAFKHLEYPTYWFDNSDVIKINIERTLFLTEGNVDEKIPINKSCYYVMHNCNAEKYKDIPISHRLAMQVYTHDAPSCGTRMLKPFHYYLDNLLFFPWATDLLPAEIDTEIELLKNRKSDIHRNESNFVGMPVGIWKEFKIICGKKGITYKACGGFTGTHVDSKTNKKLIQRSIIAPALQSEWQVEHGYIPCRIFKNISYGKMGMTNNKTVWELFGGKILYDQNVGNLVDKGLAFEKQPFERKKEQILSLMREVRDNHTYLNRVESILTAFRSQLMGAIC